MFEARTERGYVRFVALGDSATCDVGDPASDGSCRGWARMLADAIAEAHHVSFLGPTVPAAISRWAARQDVATGRQASHSRR
jgi:hypothetical protein